ncbi:phosphotransferase family protein [Aliicoccus persicus]|uniref:Predicted kinase, aminoglycoside phosphotransferase (APT) family n=1 Tax=Aliicoccus persicus TaxID=930138 RepID=A0A662Z292_9STAP|nr:phosphotransferase [Aliicoccus persicus]SEV93777.1 Predicted kinase, aminoglycoside phosphotransferase (APT) family [Aliicoccus persicus]
MESIIEALHRQLEKYEPTAIYTFNEGWSDDDKFIVETKSGGKYLLRLSNIDKASRAQRQVKIIEQAMHAGIPTQTLIDYGPCLNNERYFILLKWIEVEPLLDKILSYSEDVQYNLGRKAGHYLQKVHQFSTTYSTGLDWDVLFNRKIDKKLEMYENCPLKYDRDQELIEAVQTYRKNLSATPQVVHHGDYHLGNMLIDKDRVIYIIDFDRHDVGDAWEEFNRLPFSYDVSPTFASGLVDAYFNDVIPHEFWEMVCLYTSTNALSALPWALRFGDDEITTMKRQTESLYKQYNNFNDVIPQWYHR